MSSSTARRSQGGSSLKDSRLWNALRHVKHKLVLRFAPRKNRVYTQFCRFPHQYQALLERVIPALRGDSVNADSPPLEIVMFACCSGAEAFSLSHVLQKHFPELRFSVKAFDIVEDVIERARTPVFSHDEIHQSPFITEALIAEIFDKESGSYRVKPSIAEPITFAVGDMLDDDFMDGLGSFDLVYAQNVLFHLPRPKARLAFGYLCRMLKSKGALFVNGMDTDMRVTLSKRHHLRPLDYLVEEIHDDARVDRGSGWASAYWGRQPFSRKTPQWLRKYCTIFYNWE
jgi:chemotaxis methyl-accepting protein methylase